MINKYNFIQTFIRLLLLAFIGFGSAAVYAKNNQYETQNEKVVGDVKESNDEDSVKNQVNRIHNALALQAEKDNQIFFAINDLLTSQDNKIAKKILNLETLINYQEEKINTLSLELKRTPRTSVTSGLTFETWNGLLLATAALILGAVGIGVAILSFIGYRELIEKGAEQASEVATKVAREEIERLIEDGSFDAVVSEAMERIMYRDIVPGTDLDAGEIVG